MITPVIPVWLVFCYHGEGDVIGIATTLERAKDLAQMDANNNKGRFVQEWKLELHPVTGKELAAYRGYVSGVVLYRLAPYILDAIGERVNV
jgi:hypothetical protein